MLLVLRGFSTLACGNSNYFWHCLSHVDFFYLFVSGGSRVISLPSCTGCQSSEDSRSSLYRSLECFPVSFPVLCTLRCPGLPNCQLLLFYFWETVFCLYSHYAVSLELLLAVSQRQSQGLPHLFLLLRDHCSVFIICCPVS